MNVTFHSMNLIFFFYAILVFLVIRLLFVNLIGYLAASSRELQLECIEAWFRKRVRLLVLCLVESLMEGCGSLNFLILCLMLFMLEIIRVLLVFLLLEHVLFGCPLSSDFLEVDREGVSMRLERTMTQVMLRDLILILIFRDGLFWRSHSLRLGGGLFRRMTSSRLFDNIERFRLNSVGSAGIPVLWQLWCMLGARWLLWS